MSTGEKSNWSQNKNRYVPKKESVKRNRKVRSKAVRSALHLPANEHLTQKSMRIHLSTAARTCAGAVALRLPADADVATFEGPSVFCFVAAYDEKCECEVRA